MRKVKVSSISMFNNYNEPENNNPSIERNINICCERLEMAGKAGADIVSTPECCITIGTNIKPGDIAEEIPGKISKRYSEIASKYNMYILGWLYEKNKTNIYNSLVLFNRKGEIVDSYHKVHITTGEKFNGITPGTCNSFKVFHTEFGPISAIICFDGFFQESFQVPALKGAEIIFYSLVGSWSDYIPGKNRGDSKKSEELWLMRTRAYAYINSVYIVVSGCCWQSTIIDPSAKILSTNHKKQPLKWDVEKVVISEINLDNEIYFASGNELGNVPRRRYLSSERRPSCYKEICDPKIPIYDKKWIKNWLKKD